MDASVRMTVVTLADRPDLLGAWWGMPTSWPEFMYHDPVAQRLVGRTSEIAPHLQLAGLGPDGDVVACLRCIPFAWDGDPASLPDRGWDAILERGVADAERGREPTAVSLLEATVRPDQQGHGLSAELLMAARRTVAGQGLPDLFGPVRPSGKSAEPRTSIGAYVARRRADGLPADPWLRVHVRLGGRVVRVAPLSMTIAGTPGDWRAWTGLPFDTDGDVEVPGALTPVHVDLASDHVVYVEPNVWVRHRVGP